MKKKNKNIDDKIDDLARVIKIGFDGVDKGFEGVNKKFDRIEGRLDILETGQEEIKLKLDNVAYRFELKELEQRIILLERKIKMR